MANGSLPSLDVSKFAETAIEEEQKRQQDVAGNLNLDGFTQEIIQSEIGRVSAAARWAKQFDPESYAKAQKLAPGAPPDVAARQLPTLEQIEKTNAYSSVFDKAPEIRQHFARFPKDLPNAHPDELDQLTGINWSLQAFSDAFGQGQEQAELAMLRWKQMAGTSTPAEDKLAEQLAATPGRTFGAESWVQQGLVGTAQSLPMMIQSVIGGTKGAVLGSVAGAAGGSVAGGVGAIPGAIAGAAVGGTYGSLNEAVKLQQGLQFNEFLSFKDEAGNPLDPTVAKWAAFFGGLGAGALEQLGISRTLGQVPGLDRVLGTFSADGMKTILRNPVTREAFTRFAKNLGEAVVVETLTETGQEGLAIFAGELAKASSPQEFEMLTTEEVTQRMLEAGVQALQVMTLLGPVTAGTRFAADLHTMRRSKRESDNLKKIALKLEGNGLIERAPAVASALIDAQAGDQKVYIPAEELRTLYQEQGLDVYGPQLPNWRQRFDEALASGGDVEVTMGEFLTALGTDPQANPIYTLARADPSSYTAAEIMAFSEGMDELIGSELQRAEGRITRKLDDKVKQAVAEQVGQLGFTPEATNFYSTLLGSYFNAQAERLGIDPLTLFQQNLQMTREDLSHTIENGNDTVPSLRRLLQSAYHGSRAIFDRFSTDFMGTGEGAQAFGWGLYFAQDKALAGSYRKKLSRREPTSLLGGQKITGLDQPTAQHISDLAEKSDPVRIARVMDELIGSTEKTYEWYLNQIDFADPAEQPNIQRQMDAQQAQLAALHLVKEGLAAGKRFRAVTGPVVRVNRQGQEFRVPARTRGHELVSQEVQDLVTEIDGLTKDDQYILGVALTKVGDGATTEEALDFIEQQVKMTSLPLVGGRAARFERLKSIFTALEPVVEEAGRLYEVNLPEDEQLLLWDEPLSQQDPKVQEALAKLGFTDTTETLVNDLRATEHQITIGTVQNVMVDSPSAAHDEIHSQIIEHIRANPGILNQPSDTPIYIYAMDPIPGSTVYSGGWSIREPALDETLKQWIDLDEDLTGEEIYEELKNQMERGNEAFLQASPDPDNVVLERPDKLASLALHDAGILGHKFLDGNSRAAGQGTYNFVIYTDEAIEIKRFEQSTPEGARGAITFQPDQPALIQLFEKADMSTLLHEASHFFLETTKEWASQSPEIAAQWEVIKKHLKVGEDNVLTTEQHEQFAKWGEAYFMEGKAPNVELRSAFQAFRQWLKAIYRSIRNLGGSVHPEIRGVFDSMLTADDRFDALSNDTAYAPMFQDAASMGVSPEDYLEYQRWVQTWRDEAQDQTISRVVGQQKRLLTAHYKKIRTEIFKNTLAHLATQPPYIHRAKFKEPGFAMSTEAFANKYGTQSAKAFPREAFNKAGLDPEVVAALLGYPTADEMVYDFTQAPPIRQAAAELTEKEMIRRHGEDFQNQAILDLAVKQALAQDARTAILGKEYQVLSRKAGREVSQNAPRQLAQEIARRTVYRKKVKDVNEHKSQAAARRAGVMAETAMRKGDWVSAADWKRKQLLAQAIDNETQVLNRTLAKIRDKAAKYTKTAPKSIDPGAMEQIRALVTQYHFAKVPLRQIAKTEKLREWLAKQEAEGLVPQVPDHLLRRAEKLNWKELSVEELLGLGDTLDNLEHMGRLKHKLRTAKGLREFNSAKAEIIERLNEAAKLRVWKSHQPEYVGQKEPWTEALRAFHASILKPEQLIEFLDAEQIGGPLATYVFEPIAQAQNQKNDLNLQYNSKLMEIFEKFPSQRLLELVEIKSLREKMTRENIIAIALNTGNSSNREKLLQGELWTEAQLQEILSFMSKDDWDRVQEVWELLDGLWEKEAALEKRLTGVAPPKIEAKEFTNQYGTYRGGYYPVVYDFKARRGLGLIEDITPQDKKGDIESDLFPKNFTPGTNHKHLVARQKVAKPFRRDLHVLPGHIHNVIHDLTYREAIRSAYKVLWDPDISRGISEVQGETAVTELRQWLRAVATEHAYETDPTLNFFTHLRVGATMVGMGFRMSTALSQFLGVLPALTRVGARPMATALWHVARNHNATVEMVNGLSGELRHRFNNQDREIRETVRTLVTKPTPVDKIRAVAFVHIGLMDRIISTATWLAAYQQQLEADPKNQDLAIQAGDRVVRLTQGTGTVKDFAGIMNRGGFWRLFTMFYSFFSAQYAMQSRLTRQTIRDIQQGNWEDLFLKRLPDWSKLVVFPAILGALITGQGPEDDENPAAWAVRKTLLYPFAAIPLVRDVAGAAQGFPFRLSPVAKAGEEAGRALYNLIPDERRDYHPEKAIEPAAAAASVLLRLPTDQIFTSSEALWKGVANDDLTLGDLLYGRRDK